MKSHIKSLKHRNYEFLNTFNTERKYVSLTMLHLMNGIYTTNDYMKWVKIPEKNGLQFPANNYVNLKGMSLLTNKFQEVLFRNLFPS